MSELLTISPTQGLLIQTFIVILISDNLLCQLDVRAFSYCHDCPILLLLLSSCLHSHLWHHSMDICICSEYSTGSEAMHVAGLQSAKMKNKKFTLRCKRCSQSCHCRFYHLFSKKPTITPLFAFVAPHLQYSSDEEAGLRCTDSVYLLLKCQKAYRNVGSSPLPYFSSGVFTCPADHAQERMVLETTFSNGLRHGAAVQYATFCHHTVKKARL